MLKRTLIALLIALPFSVFAQKFGVVDIQSVLTAMPEYTTAQNQLQESSKKYQDELTKLQDEINKKYTDFQALQQDSSTPQKILESRIQEIQDLDQKIQQFNNTAAQDLQRQQQQLMAPIEQKLLDAIKAVGQEGGYTYILPMEVPIYYGGTAEDVTPAVRTRLGIQ